MRATTIPLGQGLPIRRLAALAAAGRPLSYGEIAHHLYGADGPQARQAARHVVHRLRRAGIAVRIDHGYGPTGDLLVAALQASPDGLTRREWEQAVYGATGPAETVALHRTLIAVRKRLAGSGRQIVYVHAERRYRLVDSRRRGEGAA